MDESTCQEDSSYHFKVIKAWSIAGVGTSILVESRSGTKIAFDIGSTPIFQESISANIVLLSHGHLDHTGSLFSHARAHYLLFNKKPTYYVPSSLVNKIKAVEAAMWALDSANTDDAESENVDHPPPPGMPINIVGVHPGDEIYLGKTNHNESLLVRVFAVQHEVHPSVGYVICRQLPQKLRPEFEGLPATEIRDLVQQRITIKADVEIVAEIAYTGDTCKEGLCAGGAHIKSQSELSTQICDSDRSMIHLCQAFQASIIFCELTYLDNRFGSLKGGNSKEPWSRGHMAIGDVAEVISSHGWDRMNFARNSQRIVFFHLSARHGPATTALDLLLQGLPDWLIPRCYAAIYAILSNAEKRGGSYFPIELVEDSGCISLAAYKAARYKTGTSISYKQPDTSNNDLDKNL